MLTAYLAVLLLVSDLFERLVDRPALRLSRKVRREGPSLARDLVVSWRAAGRTELSTAAARKA
ncbi:MAG: hypothetical protein R3D33_09710 [Hyphomicrobiaceae bacterium]